MSRTYTTKQGDMWDGIAFQLFGNVCCMDALMNANQQYREIYIFSAGEKLKVPDLETTAAVRHLPPWKQVQG